MSNTPVTKNNKADLKEALDELLSLVSEREKLETQIAKQKKRVAALYELVETDEGSGALAGLVEGISDACRVVFRAAEKPLLPAEIRDRVQALGLPPQANLLASVHTTIKRMEDAGELKKVIVPLQSGGTGTAYTWVSATLKLSDLIGNVAAVYGAAATANQIRPMRRPAIPHRRREPVFTSSGLTRKQLSGKPPEK